MERNRICCPHCSQPLALRQLVLLSPFRSVRCRACRASSVPSRWVLWLSTPLFILIVGLPALAARQGVDALGPTAGVASAIILAAGFWLYLLALQRWLKLKPIKAAGNGA